MLDQCLPDALQGAAVELSDHYCGIDNPPDIVDRGIGHYRDFAGLGGELNLADMAGVGPGRPAHRARGFDMDAPPGLGRGQLKQADTDIGAAHAKAPAPVVQVVRSGFQMLGGQGAGLFNGTLGAHLDSGATGKDGARAGTAKTSAPVGVAHDDAHLFDRNLKHIHHQLRQRGGDALPHTVDRRKHLDHAVSQHGDSHALFECLGTGPFQKGGNAQAAPLAAPP